ncbi:outer membrane protein assembly factor BamC [Gilliamella sp. B2776]|uniref:outer membrane protein assembly factor BamC n=1 Tax=unclassified Gilliamella TaxID=2685620 RepID=UPI00226981CF|nr:MULTISPECIES: outer membrane protein assembly factor BamC [unclassified Gilliamella]MCX8650801.1 outer membrane protein assembly factor BamC [Gilliamella sp. B2779]MCX8654220.1 outer membrane protein assembly factor BamC [Gilliamella sp. B2737]MCX8664880.1 outer membrane protein assembly factor BamC [Gilliamella sp. B2887]MCX8692655.1 outer membrane protein assembly factor BamC [Gilliamella sp. B2776]MCX8697476.1 outer membrane protein assembly factor BamC [Gilliamella sp. B3000]
MFNKTILHNYVLIKTVILTAIVSLLLVGCGSDQNYKREIDGNEDYLNSPALKPLIIPKGMTIPAEIADFFIYKLDSKGNLGKQVDIRPPVVPIPTVSDAFVIYNNGVVTFNSPLNADVWNKIPNTLNNKNIPISSSDNFTIKTGKAFIIRADETQTAEASFIFKRQIVGDTETITVSLDSLTRGTEDISSQPIEVQRYVVGLFNSLMDDVAPQSFRELPVKDSNENEAKK